MTRSLRSGTLLLLVLLLAALASPVGATPLVLQGTAWNAEYYSNVSLSGAPTLVRSDATIDFIWADNTSPAPGIGTSGYSVRWTRSTNFAGSGDWTFFTTNDDGMRVWVDGVIVVDAWYDQGATSHQGTLYVASGPHVVKVEYYNRNMGGTARMWYSLGGSASDWKAEYFGNQDLGGAPVHTRTDGEINFNWGTISPAPDVPADHFSVRWTRMQYFSAATWHFTTTTDDGVRLWVDDRLLIDRWYAQSLNTYTADVWLPAGNHTVRMEYFDSTMNAVAQLSFVPVAPGVAAPFAPGGGLWGAWHGQYYDNASLDGNIVMVRDDPSLHYNWGTASPGTNVPPDYFSVKWDSTQVLPVTGNYAIVASADDGIRVWIDGALVIDFWYDHSSTVYTANRMLTAGPHAFHVEYYDKTVNAQISLDIVPPSTAAGVGAPVPAAVPGVPVVLAEVIVDNGGVGFQSGGDASGWRTVWSGRGGRSLWTLTHASAVEGYNWVRWYPPLLGPGNYQVSAFIPKDAATTMNARYWIYHNGTYHSMTIDQTSVADEWLPLGTYYFNARGGEFVSLSDVTADCDLCASMVFDAVRFTPR